MKTLAILLLAVAALADAACDCQPVPRPVGKCPAMDGEKPTYLLDQNERGVFYECSNGIPNRQECPLGLVFNPLLNVCDYPSMDSQPSGPVGECPRHTGIFLVYLRDKVNPSVFYVCNKGKAVRYNCAKGKIFNTHFNACFDAI